MQIDQLHRQLNSDPDNVELARQLWNALLREQIPAELADIDVTDPSPKNWKAILRLVNVSEQSFRPVLLDVLKPLLRLWPIGSRPLLDLESLIQTYSTQATFDSGAWQLLDEIDFILPHKYMRKLYKTGHTELANLNFPELAIHRDTRLDHNDWTHSEVGFPKLKQVEVLHGTDLFEFLCSPSSPASVTRSSITDLKVFVRNDDQVNKLLSHCDLLDNLEQLTIQVDDTQGSVFDYSWPNLKSLTIIALRTIDLSDLDCIEVPKQFANVSSIKVQCPLNAISLSEGRQPANFEKRTGAKTPKALLKMSRTVSDFQLELTTNSTGMTVWKTSRDFDKLKKHVTFWDLYFDASRFCIPPHSSLQGLSIHGIGEPLEETNLRDWQSYFSQLKQIDFLEISDPKLANVIIAPSDSMTPISVKRLSIELDESHETNAKLLSTIQNMPTDELFIRIHGLVQFENLTYALPQSITSLGLDFVVHNNGLLDFLAEVRALKRLILRAHQHDINTIQSILSHDNCKNLETLSILLDSHLHPKEEHPFDDRQWWATIRLPELKTLQFPFLSWDIRVHLLDQFPKLLNVRRW